MTPAQPKHISRPPRLSACAMIQAGLLAALAGAMGVLLTPPKAPAPALAPASFQHEANPASEQATQDGITECVITLISGRKITGELIRQDGLIVVVGIDGIETTFQRRNVAQVQILPPIAERYAEMRESIDDDDIDARLALVEWLRARRAYTLALKELDAILLADPANPHAKVLHTWLSEYQKLHAAGAKSEDTPDNTGGETPDQAKPTRVYQIKRNTFAPLSDEQINLMRVYEIDLRDPPRVEVPDEVIEELINRHPESFSPDKNQRQRVFALPQIEKLKLLFSLKARDLYAKVRVLEEPDSIDRFKDDVHNTRAWLVNACASTRCHGGVDAGSFRLLNTRPNTNQTAYTNLYIIEHSTLSDGTPLINFNDPDRSPLLQMGMIQANALTPHPELPKGYPGTGFRPVFRTTRDRKYQQALEWIRSMYQPRPDYGFQYDAFKPKPAQPEQSPAQSTDAP